MMQTRYGAFGGAQYSPTANGAGGGRTEARATEHGYSEPNRYESVTPIYMRNR
jgi:hypothetical protein